jgi:hypothetical protein
VYFQQMFSVSPTSSHATSMTYISIRVLYRPLDPAVKLELFTAKLPRLCMVNVSGAELLIFPLHTQRMALHGAVVQVRPRRFPVNITSLLHPSFLPQTVSLGECYAFYLQNSSCEKSNIAIKMVSPGKENLHHL